MESDVLGRRYVMIRLKYFIIFATYFAKLSWRQLYKNYCEHVALVLTPCREQLSTRRIAEILLILEQIMCTEQRPS